MRLPRAHVCAAWFLSLHRVTWGVAMCGHAGTIRDAVAGDSLLACMQLFHSENPADAEDWKADVNRESEEVLKGVMISPRLLKAKHFDRFQFERLGYFCVDIDSTESALVFNRTCTLRDTYADKR